MGAQPVACACNLDHDSVVQETIEQRGGDDWIAEDFSPFRKAAIGCQDHGPFLITGVDQLEEEVGPSGCDGQVSDLIDDQQRRPGIEPDLFAQPSLSFRLAQGAISLASVVR